MSRAEIIAIGDELLSGETVDTNSNYIDRALEAHGFAVQRHVTVADEERSIVEAFRDCAQRAELVISTGGLGPTRDDLTMAALAKAMNVSLRRDEATLETIRARFASFGREMTPNNEQQAYVPSEGQIIPNAVGTAPSFWAKLDRADVFVLPGVPREMRYLLEHEVLPKIPRGTRPVFRKTVKVIGFGESRLEFHIRSIMEAHPDVLWGFRALGAENHVKMAVSGEEAKPRLDAALRDLRQFLGPQVYGTDDAVLADLLRASLVARRETVAVAESCTGGLVGKLLTDVSGASGCFLGGVIAYANEVKTNLLGVRREDIEREGAVSCTVAEQMAEGVRARLGATYGLSTTGVAGPEGGTAEKPVGLVWVGVAGPTGVEAQSLRIPGDRAAVRQSASIVVLDLLRRRLGVG